MVFLTLDVGCDIELEAWQVHINILDRDLGSQYAIFDEAQYVTSRSVFKEMSTGTDAFEEILHILCPVK